MFFIKHHFYLNDKQICTRFGYLADVFSKINEANLLLKGKQLTILLRMIKLKSLSGNKNFEKKLIICFSEFDSLPILKDFYGDFIFIYKYTTCMNIAYVYNSVNGYFPNDQYVLLQNQSYMDKRAIQNGRQSNEFP